MAATFVVSCPGCDKRITVPAELQGRKIKCKECTTIIEVPVIETKPSRSAKAAAPPPKAGKAGAAPEKKPAWQDEDEDDQPYSILKEDEAAARCPHCAQELEEDAIVCIKCGFNTRTRQRSATRKIIETTSFDYFMWLGPGIGCVVLILFLIGFDYWYCMVLPDLVKNGDYEFLSYKAFPLWLIIFSLFGMYYSAKFAFKRLIMNPTPPEKEVPIS